MSSQNVIQDDDWRGCFMCGKSLEGLRRDAVVCGDRCRQRLKRWKKANERGANHALLTLDRLCWAVEVLGDGRSFELIQLIEGKAAKLRHYCEDNTTFQRTLPAKAGDKK